MYNKYILVLCVQCIMYSVHTRSELESMNPEIIKHGTKTKLGREQEPKNLSE